MDLGVSRPMRAVLFDVDGTLYHQPVLRGFMAAELAASLLNPWALQRALQTAHILRAYRHAHEDLRRQGVASRSLKRLQFEEAARRTGVSERQVEAAVVDWMIRRPLKYLRWCRRPDLEQLLDDLRARGIQLGVLSDYPAVEKLTALGIADRFSLVLCTSDREIGAFKPDPRGFWRACELWNLSPEEVVYVGDRPDVDGQGAAAAGLRSVVLTAGRRGDRILAERPYVAVRRLGDIERVVFS